MELELELKMEMEMEMEPESELMLGSMSEWVSDPLLPRSISRRCSNSRCRLRPKRSFGCRSTLPCDRFAPQARWWCWWLSNCRCRDYISRQR